MGGKSDRATFFALVFVVENAKDPQRGCPVVVDLHLPLAGRVDLTDVFVDVEKGRSDALVDAVVATDGVPADLRPPVLADVTCFDRRKLSLRRARG